jgi:hypothetical protein
MQTNMQVLLDALRGGKRNDGEARSKARMIWTGGTMMRGTTPRRERRHDGVTHRRQKRARTAAMRAGRVTFSVWGKRWMNDRAPRCVRNKAALL